MIEIPIKPVIKTNELDKIIHTFKKYSKYDIFLKIDDDIAKIFLHSLDFAAFKSEIDFILHNYSGDSPAIAFFETLLSQIESIKSYGLKGTKRVYVGYNDERKVKNRLAKETKRQQYYYAQDNNFSSENTDLPDKYINKIICGDSKLVLSDLPNNCIDIVVTSPPYNFGLDYSDTQDAHHWDNYFTRLFSVFDECVRVVKYGGRIIVNVQPLFSDYIPTHHIISNYFINKKLIWKSEILWEKNNYNCKYTAWGSWKSPSNPYLKYTWEFLEVFCKGSLKKEGKTSNADITGDEFKKWVLAVWKIAPERNMKEYGHPAMFPEELITRALKLFSFKNDIVLDPFNGAGTTTLVAKKLNRRYLGIDISEQYCKAAEKRVESILL
ncbi:site-specific DNA-methyltransferase [candidate division TA06 bacterium]|uniref:Methyltransferase n=1 Tax=candidate division TA06 bacterium TaxID=2250710 RepID=A0A933IES0_UNCT6|nr:site-specific DNA-methyltransferase [candidate division TA06 bacterium]